MQFKFLASFIYFLTLYRSVTTFIGVDSDEDFNN